MFWLVLVGALALIAYVGRASEGKPDPNILYEWSTAIFTIVQEGFILALVLAIAHGRHDLLALRRPNAFGRMIAYVAVALVAIYVFEGAYAALTHPGNEQGLTPSRWEPHHAAAYIANAVVICTLVPFAEELTYRGLGYSLLRPFGRWTAILLVGLLFGLAHGLIVSLPIIVAFGCALAWIRDRTDSVIPGMFLHGTFNLIALVVAVTVTNN
ncbi:MAG TPA: type II CAAX endopeptidase family protein [Gaiellaceae bacterium]|nr:type II CAAX endopeptidase family protein [Gaiellaceae bacterium]